MNTGFKAFARHFGVFAHPQKDRLYRFSKELAEGTQRVQVEWTTTIKVGDVCLVEALAGRDGASRGHFLASQLWDGAESFVTYSKNLNTC